ncbi:hypothetical protein EXIGLDRAFT_383189 [Exidia glandulosa HHB12029]|uniref:F-box domain-containing protein n=1 Tax=Exidia glandulosa HHB12029 TaxID=1314781 RepID=A0A165L2J0_EXIGL|nr:hypothetical protein EXIGLDRAFT_383189 [Exidia glandulosa HHB12029]
MPPTLYPTSPALPNEIWLLVFSNLAQRDRLAAARCSKHFLALIRPLVWKRLDFTASWKVVKALCTTIRRNAHIASLVEHWALTIDMQDPNLPDALTVMPLLALTLQRLTNLRVLVFTFNSGWFPIASKVLDNCTLPHLESLSTTVQPSIASFIARHPNLKSLGRCISTREDIWPMLGPGVLLENLHVVIQPLLQLLEHHAANNPSVRRLSKGCRIHLVTTDWYVYARELCALLNAADVHIGELCLESSIYGLVTIPSDVKTARIEVISFLTFNFEPDNERCCRFIEAVLAMCPCLRTLKFPGYSCQNDFDLDLILAILNRFSRTCTTLRTLITARGPTWVNGRTLITSRGPTWERQGDEWVQTHTAPTRRPDQV